MNVLKCGIASLSLFCVILSLLNAMVCFSNFGKGLHEHIATNIGFDFDGKHHDSLDDDVVLIRDHIGSYEMRARKMNLAD